MVCHRAYSPPSGSALRRQTRSSNKKWSFLPCGESNVEPAENQAQHRNRRGTGHHGTSKTGLLRGQTSAQTPIDYGSARIQTTDETNALATIRLLGPGPVPEKAPEFQCTPLPRRA